MNDIIVKYIAEKIFPLYNKNDIGHNLKHVKEVIKRSFELINKQDVDLNILYVAAAYHDIGHHIDADNHEKIAAKIFLNDKTITGFFTIEERKIIEEAIEDHRASLKYEPRNIYGKIISSADRNIDVNVMLKRTYQYSIKHYAKKSLNDQIERSYLYIKKKFGNNGYAKMYFQDIKYKKYLKKIEDLLSDKETFVVTFKKANDIK